MRFSPEHTALLQILRLFLDESPLTCGGWMSLRWDEMFKLALHQNLVPILYHILSRKEFSDRVPHHVLETFRAAFFEEAAQSLRQEKDLREIVTAFQTAELPFILFKGPSMAFEFYPRVELRAYHDLDLLIREREYERAREVLDLIGYRVHKPEREKARRSHFNSVTFIRPDGQGTDVDLHWETLMVSWNPNPFLGSDDAWNHIRWIDAAGLKLPVLSPEILVPYFCLHYGLHHQFGDLISLCDLHLVVKKFGDRLDWDEMIRRTVEGEIRKPVYHALRLARLLLETEIPGRVFDRLRQGRWEERLFFSEELIFRKERIGVNRERFLKFMLIDGFRGKWNALLTFYRQKS